MPRKNILDLSIFIVNNNHKDYLRYCLESIYKNTHKISFQIVVLDNASSDGSIEMVRKYFPKVCLIREEEKRGFAFNQNRMLRIFFARSRYFLMLNDDTLIFQDTFDKLVEFMDEHPEAASIGPQLVFPDGKHQFSGGAYPSIWKEIFRYTGLGRLLLPHRGKVFAAKYLLPILPPEAQKYLKSFHSNSASWEVDYISGCAMLLRREAIEDVGLLDERFTLYGEDVDWCRRARERGWRHYLVGEVRVLHYLSQSKGYFSIVERERSQLRYFKKYRYSRISLVVYRLSIAFLSLLKISFCILTGDNNIRAYKEVFKMTILNLA